MLASIGLWAILGVVAIATTVWLVWPLIPTTPKRAENEHAARVAGYRAALETLQADREGQLIDDADARAERAGLARALLAETAGSGEPDDRPPPRRLAFALTSALPLLGLLLYLATGPVPVVHETAKDRGERQELERLADKFVSRAAANPNDAESHRLAGLALGALGRYDEASASLARALAVGPRTSETLTAYGEALALAAGATTPEALKAFDEAVERAPDNLRARMDRGDARWELGQTAGAVADWQHVQAALPPDSPARAALDARLTEAGAASSPGSGAGIAALPPAEQMDMIRGMVDGLAARLESAPNDLQGWQKLIRAYTVLGETDKADAARTRAREVFAGDPAALATLRGNP